MEPVPPQSFSRRYLQGESRLQFWNWVATGVGLVNSLIVLAALSVYHFGLYQLILATVAIADSLSTGLFDDIVFNETARGLAEGRARAAKRIYREFAAFKIIAGTVLTALLFFGAEAIGARYGADIGLFVRIASFLILIEAVKASQEIFFTATLSFSGFGIQTVQEVIKLLILIAFLAGSSFGIPQVLAASVGAALASLLASSYFFGREYRRVFGGLTPSAEPLLAQALRRYGWLVAVRYGFSRVTKNVRPWLIKAFLGTEAVAFYALAINLITLAQGFFPIGMVGRLLPWEVGNERRLRFIFARSMKYVLWGGLAAAVAAFFAVPPLVSAIFPKYAQAMPLFRAFLFILPLYGLYKIQKSLLLALREQKILTARLVSEFVLVVGLNTLLLPLAGIFGVAAEYTLTYVWRVGLFWRLLTRSHPGLRFRPLRLLRFDADDRQLLAKLGQEAVRSLRGQVAR